MNKATIPSSQIEINLRPPKPTSTSVEMAGAPWSQSSGEVVREAGSGEGAATHTLDRPTTERTHPPRNRWPQIDLVELIRQSGSKLWEKAPDSGKWEGDHPQKHGSDSGKCLVVWQTTGRWHCSSCKAGGDAADWVAHLEGISYAEASARLEARYGPAPTSYDHLPSIDAGIRELKIITPQAWSAVKAANDKNPVLFRFGNVLVRLERDPHGRLVCAPLTPDRLRNELARCANFYRMTREGRRYVEPPRLVIDDMLATSDPPLPELQRIVSVPVFAPNGQLILEPGYHPASKIYYDPLPGLSVPPVPPRPGADDVYRAGELLFNDLFADFPFVSEADRAHAVALLLLPFVRDLIAGPTPLHMVQAPVEGSGKGLLVTAALLPGIGHAPGTIPPGRDDEELRKLITSTLRSGQLVVWIDNLTRPLESGVLASALTGTVWNDRLLGKNEPVHLPVRCIWVATANNPTLSGEVARRTVHIRLDPRMEAPWRRRSFKHEGLVEWAQEHRGELIWAALVLVQNWLAHDRPMSKVAPLGSFEVWTRVMGGILECAGIRGFLANFDAFVERSAHDAARWRVFVEAWWEKYHDDPVLARDLVQLATDAELDVRGDDDAARARSLGRQLEKVRDRVFDRYRIERTGLDRKGAVRWCLCLVAPEENNPAGPGPTPDPPPPAAPDPSTSSNPRTELVGFDAPTYRVLRTATEVRELLPQISSAPRVGFDCETTGLDPRTDRLRLVQFALPDGQVYLIDCLTINPRVLEPLFSDSTRPVLVGHNLQFDLSFLWAAGLPVPDGRRLFDTQLAAQILDGSRVPLALANLVHRELGVCLDKTFQTADWSGELSTAMLDYAARDAAVLLPLVERLAEQLHQAGLDRVRELEMRALPAVVWLAQTGAPFDTDAWRVLSEAARTQQQQLALELTVMVGSDINWNSASQVRAALQRAGLAVADVTEETLASYRDRPLVARLLDYREASKRAGTYGEKWLRLVHPLTDRIHAHWNQIGTGSGRMSCTRPNLQNVPRDPLYRTCFRPAEGRVLVKADYSQIELRIAAEIAGDERMIAAYQRGEDLHATTAKLVLGRETVSKEDRQMAKALNFGLVYGMGANKLREYAANSYGVQMTEEEAQRFRAAFFRAYPGLERWHRSQPDGVVETRTLAGRRRRVDRFTEKLNTPVQGAGADGLKTALTLLWETRQQCPSAAPVLVVHDEIVLECDADEARAARDWLVGCMQRGMEKYLHRVPVVVEATICRDWSGTPHDGVKGQDCR